MRLKYSGQFDTIPQYYSVDARQRTISVGCNQDNDIVLNSPYLNAKTFEIARSGHGWRVRSFGINGIEVGQTLLNQGETVDWNGTASIIAFPFTFQLEKDETGIESGNTTRANDFLQLVHAEVVRQTQFDGSQIEIPKTIKEVIKIEEAIAVAASQLGIMREENEDLINELAGSCIRDEMIERIMARESNREELTLCSTEVWSQRATDLQPREIAVQKLTQAILRQIKSEHPQENLIDSVELGFSEAWTKASQLVPRKLREYLTIRQIKKFVKDTMFGFGPLEDLLRTPSVTEIMVNASDEIFIEKNGVLQNSGRQFVSDDATLHVIKRVVQRVGRSINASQPMVDARLPDGSRVNAIIPPLAVKGPCLTIRKFERQKITMERLLELGSITQQVVEFLEACVIARKSILVSGGTGTGKTTLLNILSQVIPKRERIICIEDTHELQLDHPHVVFVECRDGNNEGVGKVTIRDLLKNALRQRPDRLIVGECRGSEALDMLQAMNTGHDGSMTTIHANKPKESLDRLEVLVKGSGLPTDAIRQQIVSAVDVIVQIKRESNGLRRIIDVAEVVGYESETQQIRLRNIFSLTPVANSNRHQLTGTGCIPTFASVLAQSGHFEIQRFLDGSSTHLEPTEAQS